MMSINEKPVGITLWSVTLMGPLASCGTRPSAVCIGTPSKETITWTSTGLRASSGEHWRRQGAGGGGGMVIYDINTCSVSYVALAMYPTLNVIVLTHFKV